MVTNDKIFSIKHGKSNWYVVRLTDECGVNVYRLMKNRQKIFADRWSSRGDYAEDPVQAIKELLQYVSEYYNRPNIFDNFNK